MGRLFGTDGVRGVANSELTPELAFSLGRAGAYVLTKETKHTPKILVGYDTRVSADMLECALIAGMCSLGTVCYCAGVMPTPGIAYLVRKLGLDAGVAITASHNPVADNGIKFFNSEGYKLSDALEDEIEHVIQSELVSLPRPVGADVGHRVNLGDGLAMYTEFLKDAVGGCDLSGLKIALDCANGATYAAAPAVFTELGADVTTIFNEPDGLNINAGCGSTHMEKLAALVKDGGFDIGLAFDGDGDRMLAVDENGVVVNGDEVMAICANDMKNSGTLKNDTLVVTVMSNLGLFLMADRNGIKLEKTAVGDRYVLEKMLAGGYSLGGEQSGHVIFLEHGTTGDGILTALKLLAVMKKTGKKLSELKTIMEMLPQVMVNARVSPDVKRMYAENPAIAEAIKQLEEQLAGEGRVLIRPSGTEPLIRVMLEGKDTEFLKREAQRIADMLTAL